MKPPLAFFTASLLLASLFSSSMARAQVATTPTVVRIEATARIAEESSAPFRRLNLVGKFTITRSGPTNLSLPVFVLYSGSATYGVDYPSLPWLVSIPAGATSTVVQVVATPDSIAEPIETLVATLSNCPPPREPPLLLPCYDFEIAPGHGSATIFLRDDGITEASIAITHPTNNASFRFGDPISIDAVAIDLNGYISSVEFADGGKVIGRSDLYFLVPPPNGTPTQHHFLWPDASAGRHVLTAWKALSVGAFVGVTSAPVSINVEGEASAPMVRIEATRPIAEEDSAPLDRLPLVGEFTVTRTAPTNSSTSVYLLLSGTATPGKDYKELPFLVNIPAGASSVSLRVEAIPDDEAEGVETVVARLSDCPPDLDPPLGVPCYNVAIDPAHAEATVFIRDNALDRGSLTITRPAGGSRFALGETIAIDAVAIDLNGYIAAVLFYDGDHLIGESHIDFIREPDPGTPVEHHFDWSGAGAGSHVLTARATTGDGVALTSAPVHIDVSSVSNHSPVARLIRPVSGQTFPINTPITLVAEARDPDGYVPRAEFYADGLKIGEVNIAFLVPPPTGATQSFDFVWREPSPGTHRLGVRVTDNGGATGISAPVEILVAPDQPVPVITVTARDCFAVEPGPTLVLNTATFAVHRHGPTNSSVQVNYLLEGTAENGVDYERLSGVVEIAAGHRAATVVVRPLADGVVERPETVILRLQSSSSAAAGYLVGRPSSAVAVIVDQPWPHLTNGFCQRLDQHCALVAFAADAGFSYRVEASEDLLRWETVGVETLIEPQVLFTDQDTNNHLARFYRIAPEPNVLGE